MAKQPVPANKEFVFELGPPSWAYSFSLQHLRWREEPTRSGSAWRPASTRIASRGARPTRGSMPSGL